MNDKQKIFDIAKQRDPYDVWNDFIKFCNCGLLQFVYEGNAPTDKANRYLKLYDTKAIAAWFVALPGSPVFKSIAPLEFPILGGPVKTPVYSYIVPFDAREYYIAIFERMKSTQNQMILKSLKLKDE